MKIGLNLIFVVSLLSVFFSILVACFRFLIISRNESGENTISRYKFLRYDPVRNETLSGILSSTQHKTSGGYYYEYDSSIGSHFLISRFEDTEYECLGVCNCLIEDYETRRDAITKSVSRSFVILVSALTSLSAYERAKDYISKNGGRKCEEICRVERTKEGYDYITGETYTFDPDEYFNPEDFEAEIERCRKEIGKNNIPGGRERKDLRRFLCEGNCVVNPNHGFDNELIEKAKNYGCEKYKLSGEVEYDILQYYDQRELHRNVGAEFQYFQMREYCKKVSKARRFLDKKRQNFRVVHLCRAYAVVNFLNPSIKCKMLTNKKFDWDIYQ